MTDSAIKYVGVDGCTGGWISVGLGDSGCWDVNVCGDFSEVLTHFKDACVVLVDIPIGLPEDGKPSSRACDTEARKLLGDRRSSVFRVASRRFIKAAMENPEWGFGKVGDVENRYKTAKTWLEGQFKEYPGSFTSQEFHIIPKINQVDEVMAHRDKGASPKICEAHPEVCFLELNKGQPLESKHESLGFVQRFRIVNNYVRDPIYTFEKAHPSESQTGIKVSPNDVLDALALAVTAKIISREPDRLGTLPKDPKDPKPDSNGLPMEMVYALHKDKTTQC